MEQTFLWQLIATETPATHQPGLLRLLLRSGLATTAHAELTLGVLQLVRAVRPGPALVGLALAPAEPSRLFARLVVQTWHRQAPSALARAAETFFAALSQRYGCCSPWSSYATMR